MANEEKGALKLSEVDYKGGVFGYAVSTKLGSKYLDLVAGTPGSTDVDKPAPYVRFHGTNNTATGVSNYDLKITVFPEDYIAPHKYPRTDVIPQMAINGDLTVTGTIYNGGTQGAVPWTDLIAAVNEVTEAIKNS